MPRIKLRKVGNSLVATIPVSLARQLHLEADMEVEAGVDEGRLVLVPRSEEFEKGLEAYRRAAKFYDRANRELAK